MRTLVHRKGDTAPIALGMALLIGGRERAGTAGPQMVLTENFCDRKGKKKKKKDLYYLENVNFPGIISRSRGLAASSGWFG